MRPTRALVALLLIALPAFAQAPQPPADLRLTELLPNPDPAAGQREFVEILNAGGAAVDLQGWRLRDAPTASNLTNEFTFGALLLEPGRRVVVWSNGSGDALGPSWSNSPSKAVWNDGGDAVTLLDPAGTVRGWLGYGSTTQPAPAGFEGPTPAAPARGKSLQRGAGDDPAAWSPAAPTPGFAPGESGGAASARVVDVAPTVHLDGPAGVRTGDAVSLQVTVADDNGDADIDSWTLSSGATVLGSGNASFDGAVAATAPARAGAWNLTLTARDAAGHTANATLSIDVRAPKLTVSLPPGGALRFPDLRPGDRNVTSLDALTVRNAGADPATPLLDVSPFRAGAATIPVDGNLWVGVANATGTTWVRYTGPLQPLPTLAPGVAATVTLRIAGVPSPAAAGLYGTTFTVVPA